MWLDAVAHALVRAVSRLVSTPCWGTHRRSETGVGKSADAARTSACATSSPPGLRKKFGSALALLLLAGFAASIGGQDTPSFRIAVDVNLVVLHPTVRDRKGGFVSGLGEADFKVYEDRVRQSIRLFRHDDLPVTVGLVVDHSGSMRPKLMHVIAATRTFVRSSNPEDQIFVVNFNEKVTLGLPGAIRFTDRPEELVAAILNAPAAGQTALYDAVVEALDRLQAGSRDKKVLIVISDGGDNASAHKLAGVLQVAAMSSAEVYTIGIFDEDDPDRNPDVLRRLARATGGQAFFPDRLDEVVAICERIAHDIRNQYTVGYVPSEPALPGAYRNIRVEAAAAGYGKLNVRTRTGYIAGEPAPIANERAK
jgi:VWFA-related protein